MGKYTFLVFMAMLLLSTSVVTAHSDHTRYGQRYYYEDYHHSGYWHDDVRVVHIYRTYQPVVIQHTYQHPHSYALSPYNEYFYTGRYW